MKYSLLLAVALAGTAMMVSPAYAAHHAKSKHGSSASNNTTLPIPKERTVSTHHSVEIEGRTIHYTATAGTILLRGKDNKANGLIFYVAYTKDGVRNETQRPVTFLYNGGPGSSSIWLQMGGLGPYRVNVTNAGATPPAPYSVTPNPESLLNDSDLVFIDAMGTGYSRVVGNGKYKQFWGVDEDVKAFGQFIQRYLTKYQRWNSPKFLYGESYGTTRSAALSNWLQDNGVALNGVILQSSILNYFAWMPGSDQDYIYNLPTFAAIAWYHDKLPNKPASLPAFVQKVREFTDGPYAKALIQGDRLPKAKLAALAKQMHQYTGLPVDYIERANLRVKPAEFRKELMLPERKHIGRYDGRYAAADKDAILARPSFDPSSQFISPAFTAAFHWYLNKVLNWQSDHPYKVMNPETIRKWDWKHGGFGPFKLPMPYVAGDLASALRKNPYLRVLSENGYFDLATPFHGTEYDLDHMLLPASLRKHVEFKYFDSGHMIYLNPKALKKMHADLDAFYSSTLKVDRNGATN